MKAKDLRVGMKIVCINGDEYFATGEKSEVLYIDRDGIFKAAKGDDFWWEQSKDWKEYKGQEEEPLITLSQLGVEL